MAASTISGGNRTAWSRPCRVTTLRLAMLATSAPSHQGIPFTREHGRTGTLVWPGRTRKDPVRTGRWAARPPVLRRRRNDGSGISG